MKRFLATLPAVFLVSCAGPTITVELEPSSEGVVHFEHDKAPVAEESVIQEIELPRRIELDVPFTSQAPHANWDNPYQEACEEASVIMVDYFLRNADLSVDQANREIVQLTQWQEANRYKYDVTLEELATIVREYYGYNPRIISDVTKEAIMYELYKGNPVVVPLAGQQIGNPYYSGDGPPYHMLVITGYDRNEFITNDPGTKRGESYKYRHATIIDAIHDWTSSKETITEGAKRFMVIEK